MTTQVGPYRIDFLDTGRFRLDGGAMFGVVPKVLWEKRNPSDEQNRIEMALRTMLVRGNGVQILIDTGIGKNWNKKGINIYAIDHKIHDLNSALLSVNCNPVDITHVVFTHLHFDHVGGAVNLDEQGKPTLTFPNADYIVQEKNLIHALSPTEKDRASFIKSTIQPIINSGRLKPLQGEIEISSGVNILVTHGHTPGHQLVKVQHGKDTVIFCGDLIPTQSHIPIPWVMAYDLYPLTTMEEKRILLSQALTEDWLLAFSHDPYQASARVKFEEGRYLALS